MIEFDNEKFVLPDACGGCKGKFKDGKYIKRAWESKTYALCSHKCYVEFLKFKGAILPGTRHHGKLV